MSEDGLGTAMNIQSGHDQRMRRGRTRQTKIRRVEIRGATLGGYAAAVLACLIFLAAPAIADDIRPLQADAQDRTDERPASEILRDIPLSEFRSIVDGKTVYFELEDGTPWGREYYIPGTQNSVFVFHDGECFEGYWQVEGLYYCYYYRDQPSCWLTFWEDGEIKVESRSGMRQVVGKIADFEPLSCEPELLSRAPAGSVASQWPPLDG